MENYGTLVGTIAIAGGGGGEPTVDNFNLLLNSNPDYPTAINVEMSDDNEAHTCYGVAAAFSVSLPETITEIADTAFQRTSITSISGSGVETVGDYAFNNAPMLASVDLPDTAAIGISAFYHTLIDSVTMDDLTSAGAAAFGSCGRLETVHLGSLSELSENMFSNCANLTDIYLGYDGVVGIPEQEGEEGEAELNNPFNGSTDATITVHVRSEYLSAFQSDSDWTAVIAMASNDDGATITFAGDYA